MATFSQTATGGTVPTVYVRGQPPLTPDGYPVYLTNELAKIETAIKTIIALTPQAAITAPAGPVENMIRFAKAPWRPVTGQSTDRWVTYVNGAWIYLSAA